MKTLYYGGDIITMEKNVDVSAVLVNGDLIEEIGDYEVLKIKAENSINLQGHTMIPAFIDVSGGHNQAIKDIKELQKIYAKNGITTVHIGDMKDPVNKEDIYLDIAYFSDVALPKEGDGNIMFGGYKLYLDGLVELKAAWLGKPYATTDICGVGYYTDKEVIEYMEKALNEKKQILIYCNGDGAADQLLSCYNIAKAKYEFDIRPVVFCSGYLRNEQLNQMKTYNLVPSFCGSNIYNCGDKYIDILGDQRALSVNPAGKAENIGLMFTLHPDIHEDEPDMLKTIWGAVTRRTKSGKLLGEEERLTPYEALKAVTVYAANQCFVEEFKGSINKNKKADFAILSENPLKCDVDKIKDIKVLKTIKNGQVVFQN